jgi:hypothetical protein
VGVVGATPVTLYGLSLSALLRASRTFISAQMSFSASGLAAKQPRYSIPNSEVQL